MTGDCLDMNMTSTTPYLWLRGYLEKETEKNVRNKEIQQCVMLPDMLQLLDLMVVAILPSQDLHEIRPANTLSQREEGTFKAFPFPEGLQIVNR